MRQLSACIVLAAAAAIAGCSSDGTGPGALHLSFAAGAVSVRQGDSIDVTVGVVRSGIDGVIQLEVAAIPEGVTATIPDVAESATSIVIRLKASATAATATGAFTIRGASDAYAFNEASIPVTVTARGEFALGIVADTLFLPRAGLTVTTHIVLQRSGGFAGAVTLGATSPAGITLLLNPLASTDPAGTPLRMDVGAGVPAGDYRVQITGTAAGLPAQTRELVLRIDPSTPSFLINNGSPAAVSVLRGGRVIVPIPIERSAALTGAGTLTVLTAQAGIDVTFAPGADDDEVAMTVSTSSLVASGTYRLVIGSGSAGVRSAPAELVVTLLPGLVRLNSPATQNATVNQLVLNPPRVQVVDNLGRNLRYVPVTFRPVDGGTVGDTLVTTDASGVADAGHWRVGTVAQLYAVDVVVQGMATIRLAAQAGPGAPAIINKVRGDLQGFTAALTLPIPIEVRLTDAFGNVIRNTAINFAPGTGFGAANPPSAQTDLQGLARTFWSVSGGTADHTMTVSTAGVPSVVFTALAVSCNPLALNIGTQIIRAIGTGMNCPQPNTDAIGDAFQFELTETRTFKVISAYEDSYYSSQLSAWIARPNGDIVIPRIGLNPFAETLFTLPAGSYRLLMTVPPQGTSTYSLNTSFESGAGCVAPHVGRGTTITGSSELLDCAAGLSRYDEWQVWLTTGQTIDLAATSAFQTAIGFGQPFEAERLSSISTSPSLTHTAAATGFYRLRLYSGLNGGPNAYTLNIQ